MRPGRITMPRRTITLTTPRPVRLSSRPGRITLLIPDLLPLLRPDHLSFLRPGRFTLQRRAITLTAPCLDNISSRRPDSLSSRRPDLLSISRLGRIILLLLTSTLTAPRLDNDPPPRPRRLLLPVLVSTTSEQRLELECWLPVPRQLQRGRVICSDRFLSTSLL